MPVTEIVYVHSKLMIVDDQSVICGSANINDRSMKGTRDSEIAVVIEDHNKVNSLLAGSAKKAGNFAIGLRKALYKEHFGITNDEEQLLDDPIDKRLIKLIQGRIKVSIILYVLYEAK